MPARFCWRSELRSIPPGTCWPRETVRRPLASRGRSSQTNPRDGEARLFLGSILAEDGSMPEAVAQLKEAVRLMPRSAMAHNALGEALSSAGDLQSRAQRISSKRWISTRPLRRRTQIWRWSCSQAAQSDAAAGHLDRAIKIFGNSPEAAHPHYLRAKIYTERNEIEKAAAELQQAVTLRPDFAEAWSDLGQARKTLLDDDGAFAAFRRSVELDAGRRRRAVPPRRRVSAPRRSGRSRAASARIVPPEPEESVHPPQPAAGLTPGRQSWTRRHGSKRNWPCSCARSTRKARPHSPRCSSTTKVRPWKNPATCVERWKSTARP